MLKASWLISEQRKLFGQEETLTLRARNDRPDATVVEKDRYR